MKLPIYIADFETTTVNTKFFKYNNDSVVYIGYMENLKTPENYKFCDINEFLQVCRNLNQSCIIYFHNLSFDGYFILKALLKNNYFYANELTPRMVGFSCLRNGNKIYEIKWQFKNSKNKWFMVKFRCSLRMLSASVESLGQMYGMNKYTGREKTNFYDNEPLGSWSAYPEEFRYYLIRDVQIVKKALNATIEVLSTLNYNNSWGDPPVFEEFLTIGALGYKYQNNAFLEFFKGKEKLKIDKTTYDFAQKSFYGGWTQFNPETYNQLISTDNGFSCDINSAHPASMTGLLPYGDIYNVDKTPLPKKGYFKIWYEINVKSAHAKFPEVVNLLNWNKRHRVNLKDEQFINRYCQVQFNFTCFYLKEEWELLQEFYRFEGVKIINQYWAYADYYLKDFISDLYQKRLDLKKQGLTSLVHAVKIMLNASYGKHATRESFDTEIVMEPKDLREYLNSETNKYAGTIMIKNKEYLIKHENSTFKTHKYKVLVCEPLDQKQWLYNKLAASTITAYTRINIWKTILAVGPEHFLYADTDSIYFKSGDQSKVDLDQNRLGAYKIEHTDFRYFMTNGAKVYCLFDQDKKPLEARYSGINRKFLKRNMSYDLFKNQELVLKMANMKPLYLDNGIVLVWKDYKPKKRNF